nr:MAG TPA: hypothetical protein [Caudoviricetes sp.]
MFSSRILMLSHILPRIPKVRQQTIDLLGLHPFDHGGRKNLVVTGLLNLEGGLLRHCQLLPHRVSS